MRQNYRVLRILPALCMALAGCSYWGGEVICGLPGSASVAVKVRDADGQPTANGATVTIREPGYEATATAYGEPPSIDVGEDNRTGPFTVEVTKPYFTSATVNDVRTPTGRCGITGPAVVKVTLTLLPDAPPVRQVVVPQGPYSYVGNFVDKVTAYVEAAPGVSREVTWSSSDPSVITVTPDGRTRAVCRETAGSATLTATSVVDPTKKGSLEVLVDATPSGTTCF